jgi:hypothetical protein
MLTNEYTYKPSPVGTGERVRGPDTFVNISNWRTSAAACVALLLLVLPLGVSAQEITLRLLDARSGQPLKNVPVTMFAWNGPPTFRPDSVPKGEVVIHGLTDQKGLEVFRALQPGLEHLAFSIGTPSVFAGCWHLNDVSPDTVQRSGVVATYDTAKCGKSKAHPSAKPGVVTIVERRLTVWEKMRRELP